MPQEECRGVASRPLDHRPIPLLNADYKVFTRLLAIRLQPKLHTLVHGMQTGFVPGRSLHTAVDTLLATRRLLRASTGGGGAACLMLDFAKAYDSLDRGFLLEVLRRRGFSKTFRWAVEVPHQNTKAVFLVNGYAAKAIETTCGI